MPRFVEYTRHRHWLYSSTALKKNGKNSVSTRSTCIILSNVTIYVLSSECLFFWGRFFFLCVTIFFFPLNMVGCVCGGPCPWGLLFWFNSAPHGWTQSDTSDPVKGDAQWSWSYTTADPQRKDRLVLRQCLHVQTLPTPVETTENLHLKRINKANLTQREDVLPNRLIVQI